MHFAWWILVGAAAILWASLVLWVLYVAIMSMRARLRWLPRPARIIGNFVLLGGVLVDIGYNLVPGTVLFLQLPRQWLLTARLQVILRDGELRGPWFLRAWPRRAIARWLCDNLIEPFDPGHCG